MNFGDLEKINEKEKLNGHLQNKIKDLEYITMELEKEKRNEKKILKEEIQNLVEDIDLKDIKINELDSELKILERKVKKNIKDEDEIMFIINKKEKEIKKIENNLDIYLINLENNKINKSKHLVKELDNQHELIRKLSTDIELKNKLNSDCFQKILELKKTKKPVIRKKIINQIKKLIKSIKIKKQESIKKWESEKKIERKNSKKSINTISIINSIDKNHLKIIESEKEESNHSSEIEIHNLLNKRYSRISLSKFNREQKKNNLQSTRISLNDFHIHGEYNLRKSSTEITDLQLNNENKKIRTKSLYINEQNQKSHFERFESFDNKSVNKLKFSEIVKFDYKDDKVGKIDKKKCSNVIKFCTEMLFQFNEYSDYNF